MNSKPFKDLRSSLYGPLREMFFRGKIKNGFLGQLGSDYGISSDGNLCYDGCDFLLSYLRKEKRKMTEKKKGRAAAKLNPGLDQPLIKAAKHFTYFREKSHLVQVGKTFNFAGKTEAFLFSTEEDEEVSIITPYGNLTIVLSKIELYNLQRAFAFHIKTNQPVFCRKDGRTYIPKGMES